LSDFFDIHNSVGILREMHRFLKCKFFCPAMKSRKIFPKIFLFFIAAWRKSDWFFQGKYDIFLQSFGGILLRGIRAERKMQLSKYNFKTDIIQRYIAQFKTNEVIFWENDPAFHFYIILEGSVEIRRMKKDGNVMPIATLKAGEFFGEMSLLNQLPRTGTAIAKEKTKLLVMTQEQLNQMLADDPKFAMKMIKMLCERLKKLGDVLVQI